MLWEVGILSNNKQAGRSEKLFDTMLKAAAEEAAEQEMDALPSREDLEKLYPRSEAFEKRIAKIIRKHERAAKTKRALTIFYRAAASMAIVFTVGVITLMSVEASRAYILSRFIEIDNDEVLIGYRFGEISGLEFGELLIGYVPEGITFDYKEEDDGIVRYIFVNEAGHVDVIIQHLIVMDDGDSILMGGRTDSPYIEFSVISLHGQPAYLFKSTGEVDINSTVTWNYGRHFISVTAWLDVDELLKIAENITINYSGN
ncbi:MAG: DUF4367 domain-containing protein [Defluviitaleaceae bacterium]|nr:DUF4367 domain-containing protein [Defluviitaleaceae bacterium]